MTWRDVFERRCEIQEATRYLGPGYDVCRCGGGCESILECDFWHHMRKTRAREFRAMRQVEIGRFRVDCLCDCDGQMVVVELDGKEFHQHRQLDDHRRDCQLIRDVHAIIRIPYAAMHFYPRATFRVLEEWFPRFAIRHDIFVMKINELRNEIEQSVGWDAEFTTRKQWLDWAETRFELWHASEIGVGWVGSPRAWLERWNVSPITMRIRGPRDQEIQPEHVITKHVESEEDLP